MHCLYSLDNLIEEESVSTPTLVVKSESKQGTEDPGAGAGAAVEVRSIPPLLICGESSRRDQCMPHTAHPSLTITLLIFTKCHAVLQAVSRGMDASNGGSSLQGD
jgi:hypothetical protein